MDEDFKARLNALDEEQQEVVQSIAAAAVRVLTSENGAMLVVYDLEGTGEAMMLAAGNQFVIGPMLKAARYVGDKIFTDAPEAVQ